MKTEDLIRALVADHAARRSTLEWELGRAVVLGSMIATGLYAVMLGPRPDIVAAAGEPRFAFKLALTILLATTSLLLGLRLVRPAAGARTWFVAIAAVPMLLSAAVLVELIAVPRALWPTRLIGS